MSRDLAKWRFEKAENAYREGIILFNANSLSGAVNRFYYAAFHAMRAVLATKGLDAPKHSGVISIFNKEFVKPGAISKNASKIVTLAAINILVEGASSTGLGDVRLAYKQAVSA